ncbi:MAG: efflux RND transporter periplasmic adaptor subunit [Paenibacillaceae bacterium]
MKKKKWWLIILVAAVAAFSVFLFLQSKPSSDQSSDGSSSLQTLSFPVERKDISNSIEIKGKTSYAEETWIYAPFSSTVKQWHVEEGQSVTKDTVLFELDNGKLHNEISLAEEQLLKQQLISKINEVSSKENTMDTSANETQQAFERFAKKEEAKLQLQLDKIQLTIAELELNDKKNRLQQSAYTSPKSGIFLFAEQQKPKSVSQDVALGKIVELTSLQLLCTVTEYDIFRIKEGMEVDIRIDAQRQMKIKGIVEHVSKFAKIGTDQGTTAAQFEVRISLDQNSELIAGLSLTGKIVTDSKKAALVVPTLAVMHEDEQYFVYVATPSGVERKVISIGLETAEKTEVLEGLAEGDTVVLQ